MPFPTFTRRLIGRSRRTRRIAPAEFINAKTVAAAYVLKIKKLREELRAIRAKYRAAKNPLEAAHYQLEFNMAAHFPIPTYPSDDIIKYISKTNRWRILATASLIKRGLHSERLFDEHVDKLDAFGSDHEFKRALKHILKGYRLSTPPRYTIDDSNMEIATPDTPIYPPVANPSPPKYSPPPAYQQGGRTLKHIKKHKTRKISK